MIIYKSFEIHARELLNYYQNKDFAKAQDLAKLMIKKFPYNNLSWQILSFIHLEKGKIKEAYEAISKASKIDPKDFKVLINLGSIQFKLGKLEDIIYLTNKGTRFLIDNLFSANFDQFLPCERNTDE